MIARISGRLEEVRGPAALIDTGGGLWYEVMTPACDVERLARRVGQEIVLHTIHHLEGDPTRGSLVPRLIGFLSEADREFFKIFTTVKGIGARKALRALCRPVSEIAAAIGAKDAKLLKMLPEIGPRMAERIVTELYGKVDEFAGELAEGPTVDQMSGSGIEAISVLVQLGERRADAASLVERVLAVAPDLDTPEAIIQHVYKLKGGGV